ncbi:MAG: sigma 54-interacting transcriptional regulator [Deltaproteobacteria bacterium]|nr:sigma 54-interacting transcriptional regulator [Deltaproteobacteria bacterium]MBW2180695.1 sigma 54-interacting transcriptional regulator [Deltaproteobacteria bacterium]
MVLSFPQITDLYSLPIDFQQFIDEIPVGVLILDKDRRVVMLNRAIHAITGFSQEEAIGISCAYILRSRKCMKNCPFLDEEDQRESVSEESDLINRERQLVPVRITFVKLKDIEENVSGYVEIVEDLRSLKKLHAEIGQGYSFSQIIGKSEKMQKINQVLPVIARSDSSVLITGETGTGKDLVAEAIHHASDRSKGQFIKVNCGALPETLLESELFGHVKGAFTGAVENKPGRFRLAHNGTLFLTEIGDLPFPLQVKLLTFLDDKIVHPLGSTKGFQADVRIIGGTHRNLSQMVRDGQFREDLMFRLNVVRLHLPPLRERGDDILLLMDFFLNTFKSRFNKRVNGFSKQVLQTLKNYSYPGNVRELRNIIEYAINICTTDQVETTDIPSYITETDHFEGHSITGGMGGPKTVQYPYDPQNMNPTEHTWAALERKMILDALLKSGGKRNNAAEMLGWGRSTLWRKMKQYGID